MVVGEAVALAAGPAVVVSAVLVVWDALGVAASVTMAVYFGVAVGAAQGAAEVVAVPEAAGLSWLWR